ncbi:hypothetical protein H0H93_011821 [Arthromyces matolae]|nr:hypothetical protein H0H93_011821 [Arthromyces matolae]
MSFERARLTVREAQRAFLELMACLDYWDIYKPRLSGQEKFFGEVAAVNGCFTYNMGVCEDMYRIGVPVYLIRSQFHYETSRVKDVVTAIRPAGNVNMNLATTSYPVIYRGAATSLEKYSSHYQWRRLYQSFANPFNKHRSSPIFEPSPPQSSRSNRYSPYQRRTQTKRSLDGPAGRNKFDDPVDPMFPPPIPAWRDALFNVDRAEKNFVDKEVLPSDFGYAFPEPALFVAFEKPERRTSALQSWLRYREAFIYRLTFEASDARPMSGKAWRDLLCLDWLKTPSKTPKPASDTSFQKQSKNSTRLELLQDNLNSCLESTSSVVSDVPPGKETWCGKPFSSLTTPDFEEILWELSELNFRQELLALHLRITSSPNPTHLSVRQYKVSRCFPGRELLFFPLSEATHGLASDDQEERSPYLLAMQRLMRDWPSKKPAIFYVDRLRWSSKETETLEQEIAKYYTQTFYNYFRRAPIIPRRLSHTVPGFKPLPVLFEYLNRAPQVNYDLTQIHPLPPP